MTRDWYRGVRKKRVTAYVDTDGNVYRASKKSPGKYAAVKSITDDDSNEMTYLPWFNTSCKITASGIELYDLEGNRVFGGIQGSPLRIEGKDGYLDIEDEGITAKQKRDDGDTEVTLKVRRLPGEIRKTAVIDSVTTCEDITVTGTMAATSSGILYSSTDSSVPTISITASGIQLADYTFAMTTSGAEIRVTQELEEQGMYSKRILTWHEVAQNKFLDAAHGILVESGTNFSQHSIIMPYYTDPTIDPTIPIQVVSIWKTGVMDGNDTEYACKFKGDANEEFMYAITN